MRPHALSYSDETSGSLSAPAGCVRMCGAAELLDRELALHAGLSVPGHRAVERVAPGRESGLELRHAAVLDDLALALAVDDDVVRRAGLVGHLDRDPARRAKGRVGHERELARGI